MQGWLHTWRGVFRYKFGISWALASVALLVNALPTWTSVVDDAYISARYAAHLAQGHGLVYNIGEPRIEGFTNLAWTLLVALLLRVGVPVHFALTTLGFSFGVLALGAAVASTNVLCTRQNALTGLSAILLAVTPQFAVVTTNGLETSMFVAGILTACWAVFSQRARLLVGVGCGALCTIRPEGALVAGLLVTWDVWQHRARLRSFEAWQLALGFVALAGLVEAWRLAYYGAFVPNTFFAKTTQGVFAHLDYNKHQIIHDPVLWSGVALCVGLGILVPSGRSRRSIITLGALGIAAVSFRVHMWMPGARLLVPAMALALCVGVAAIAELSYRPRWALALLLVTMVGYQAWHRSDAMHSSDQTTAALPTSPAARAARHLQAHVPEGSLLAIRDAGLFAYWVGTAVRVAETHPHALTQPHPGASEYRFQKHTPRNPALIVTTVVRSHLTRPYAEDRIALLRTTAKYEYLGRVKQHWHRYYDIFVRGDVDVPPLPPGVVESRAGEHQLTLTGFGKLQANRERYEAERRHRRRR